MKLLKWCTQYASIFGKLSSSHRTGKVNFHSNPKKRQCQRMFKLLHNCAHFTCQFGKAQNPLSQALAICELRTSRCIVEFRKGREREIKLPTSVGSDR